ncbi:vitamin K epoxide reductase complex subunit 1-like protein 1 [Rhopilema esculentum]|uniref:vitamin K epoxide reductase complex subunit 1-like protein 1 n=1 Tax=Rhopilema esculentum TaxID=499914 RepID=UPI0031D0D2FB
MAMFNALLRFTTCIIGVILSLYALHVEIAKEKDADFKAMCDISEKMSCSKVFNSKYGTGFGIIGPVLGESSMFNVPNSIYGIAFYLLTMTLGFARSNQTAAKLLVFTSLIACVGCVYLAYILYFILNDFCVVCFITYILNFFLLFLNHQNYRQQRKNKQD